MAPSMVHSPHPLALLSAFPRMASTPQPRPTAGFPAVTDSQSVPFRHRMGCLSPARPKPPIRPLPSPTVAPDPKLSPRRPPPPPPRCLPPPLPLRGGGPQGRATTGRPGTSGGWPWTPSGPPASGISKAAPSGISVRPHGQSVSGGGVRRGADSVSPEAPNHSFGCPLLVCFPPRPNGPPSDGSAPTDPAAGRVCGSS